MKSHKLILLLVMLLFAGSQKSFGQYQMILQNGAQTSSTTFEFDVFIVSTAADFNLTSYSVSLTYNSALLNGGTLTFSYLPSTTALSVIPSYTTTMVDGGTAKLVCASSAGSQIVSATPLKVGRFRITNSVQFGNAPFTFNWNFSGGFPTIVNINNVNQTVPLNHLNYLAPYKMTLQNDTKVSDTVYEFDVFVEAQGTDFTLTSYQVCFSYNTAILNGGTLTFNYVASSSGLVIPPISTIVVTDGAVKNLISGSSAGSQVISSSPLKVGRFRITNSVPFNGTTANISWDFSGNYVTQVNISSTNLTTQGNHLNNLNNSPLPVELVSFTGKSVASGVELNWRTATEVNNYGFEVERSTSISGRNWEKIGFVKGHGNSSSPEEYSFTDHAPSGGSELQYRLKQIDNDGNFKIYDAVKVMVTLPEEFKLHQNSPNPFNPTTAIKFQMPVNAFVTVKIYDILGKEVTTLVDEERPAGSHIIYWNGRDHNGSQVSSGIYLYRLSAGSFVETRKMNLMK